MSIPKTRPHLLASLVLLIAVAMGAFGAHGLKGFFTENPDLEDIYETAVLYQFVHGLALLWCSGRPNAGIKKATWCFFIGILFFSGSLYGIVFTEIRSLGAITPIGGTLFLVGWLLLALQPSTSTSEELS
jgi:uncharacterized membrane protein YgdD (TMEM256/DUF423 family)